MIRKTIIPFILLMCLLTGCEEFANMQKENAIFDVAEHQDMAKSEFAKRYKDYGFRCDLKKGIDYCSFQTPQATIFPDFRGERLIHLYITDITNKPKFDDKGIYFFNLPTYPINQKKVTIIT
ncbi:MAG: hypothetical protein CK427_06200 [Leptospira sp.]|nr:MAG: hypothetical protein CK427_06200 [Leptospira sp.]